MKHQVRQMISRPSLQPVWLQLLKLCHAGMNCGGGQSVDGSGEIEALHFAINTIGRPKNLILFDVGANNGEYLEVALRAVGSNGRVFSFEPQASSFNLLDQRFRADSRVQLRKTALGREISSAELFFSFDHESTASLHQGAVNGLLRSEKAEISTLDQFCRDEDVERIDILKIDTEGYEMEILLGAAGLLEAERIACIQFEFGETFLQTKYHFRDLYELLAPRYTIYRVLRHGVVVVPSYSPDLEIYKIANYMCIRKTLA